MKKIYYNKKNKNVNNNEKLKNQIDENIDNNENTKEEEIIIE
jgi:hypothetical protein